MTQTQKNETAVLETIRDAIEHAAAGQVFGDPISQDGITVLPVAMVDGRGGGGSGTGPAPDGHEAGGMGGGFTLSTKPLGVYVITDGNAAWRPAVDVNRVILGGQIVAVTALLVIRAAIRARRMRGRA